jgi:hypothetical protein
MDNLSTERVLADLELTRGLTIQMLAIGTLGMLVGWALFSGLYQFTTGNAVTFHFAPASVGWLATPLNILVLVFLGTAILVPTSGFMGSLSDITVATLATVSVSLISSSRMRMRRPITNSRVTSLSWYS